MSKPYVPNDKLARKAKAENYRARSVYKLQELDQKYHLIKPGMKILDIAAAPGSWLQYTSQKIGEEGQIIGFDLQPIAPVAPNVKTFVCDINDLNKVNEILKSSGWDKADLILSDIAPSTTGIAEVDHGVSLDLNMLIVNLSKRFLKKDGTLVMKVFEGTEFNKFTHNLKKLFRRVEVTKSHASRERSKELYVICQ